MCLFIIDKVMLCIPLTLPFIPLGFTGLLTKEYAPQGDQKVRGTQRDKLKISWEAQANKPLHQQRN